MLPGGTGAGGRPPSALRRIAALEFEKRIPALAQIADDAERDGDRIKAIVALGQFAIGTAKGVDRDVVLNVLKDLAAVVQQYVTDEETLRHIHAEWKAVVGKRLAAR